MKETKFDIEIDNNSKATLLVLCGECKRKNKIPMSQASPNKIIKCGCGIEYQLRGDDLKKVQKELDNLNRTLKNFVK